MWLMPDGTVQFTPTWPGGPPPKRRRVALWVSLCVVLALVLCGAPVLVVSQFDLGGLTDAAAADPQDGPRSPRPGDPPEVRSAWTASRIQRALTTQSEALLKGDEKGFVDIADPALRGDLKREFASLRAMQVTKWNAVLASTPTEKQGTAGRTEWVVPLSLQHCFVSPTCETDSLVVGSRWFVDDGRAVLVDLDDSTDNEQGPRPWEVSELKAAAGKRVLVATTPRYASWLPRLLRAAEKAAAVADRYSVAGPPPDQYRVYVAGPNEWKQWFSSDLPEWSAGYAIAVSNSRMEIVLGSGDSGERYLELMLRHEMTHVASLRGARHQSSDTWWLSEGLAEQAYYQNQSASSHSALTSGEARQFLRDKKWNGQLPISAPDDDASLDEAGARYGLAFLAVRRLTERFTEAKVSAFFKAVLYDGLKFPEASTKVFGVAWTDVQNDVARSIRTRVG